MVVSDLNFAQDPDSTIFAALPNICQAILYF